MNMFGVPKYIVNIRSGEVRVSNRVPQLDFTLRRRARRPAPPQVASPPASCHRLPHACIPGRRISINHPRLDLTGVNQVQRQPNPSRPGDFAV
jgi:hypothetical protein